MCLATGAPARFPLAGAPCRLWSSGGARSRSVSTPPCGYVSTEDRGRPVSASKGTTPHRYAPATGAGEKQGRGRSRPWPGASSPLLFERCQVLPRIAEFCGPSGDHVTRSPDQTDVFGAFGEVLVAPIGGRRARGRTRCGLPSRSQESADGPEGSGGLRFSRPARNVSTRAGARLGTREGTRRAQP